LVEDEKLLRYTLAKVLRTKGIRVIEAADGRIALSVFQTDPSQVDLVLLDMTLPGIPGQTVLSEIRQISPEMKVILTTAYPEERALSGIRKESPVRFLRKPYEVTELYRLIESMLPNLSGLA